MERSDQRNPIRRLYACLLVRIRSCIKNRNVPDLPYKHGEKNMAPNFARFTQLLTIEFPYRKRSMGTMRLYACLFKICLCGSGLASKIGMSPTFPTKKHGGKMAATFARFTQLLMIEFPYRRRIMGPIPCVYI